MPLFGAHMSISGGVHRAVLRAAQLGCDVAQIFCKSNLNWQVKPLTEQEVERFATAVKETGIWPIIGHTCYLLNLASPDKGLRARSIATMTIELARADRLHLPYLVTHPGSYISGSVDEGLKRVADALGEVISRAARAQTKICIEMTAGQGTSLCFRFEHVARIAGMMGNEAQFGVCLDTSHLLAAGYDIRAPSAYRSTFRELDETIGVSRIKVFHLNDSKAELGRRVDRHTHIGKGFIGLRGFRMLVRDRRFLDHPMLLETPKGTRRGKDFDAVNLATLRGLLRGRPNA